MHIAYAQLNENNICVGVSLLSGEVNNPNMIKLDKVDYSLLGKRYENGNFVEIMKTAEELKKEKLWELKQLYVQLIRDAETLGETTEAERLKQEYQTKKAEIESQYDASQ